MKRSSGDIHRSDVDMGKVRRKHPPLVMEDEPHTSGANDSGTASASMASLTALLQSLTETASGLEAMADRCQRADSSNTVLALAKNDAELVESLFPGADSRVHVTAKVICIVHNMRPSDIGDVQHIQILYAIEGEVSLRAHSGSLYLYSDGAWQLFKGLLPVSVLLRVRREPLPGLNVPSGACRIIHLGSGPLC